jgi:transcriptional regulator of aromatic amino acid metabolism
MLNLLELLIQALSSYELLLLVATISLFMKAFLLILVTVHGLRSTKIQRPWFFLIPVLVGAMFSDAAWVATVANRLFSLDNYFPIIMFLIRLAWIFLIVQYQFMSLFLENLVDKNYTIKLYQKILIVISVLLCLSILYFIIFEFGQPHNRPTIEYTVIKIASIYIFLIIMPTLGRVFKKIKSKNLPKILKKQLFLLIVYLIGPSIIFDFLQYYPFSFFQGFMTSNYAAVSLSTILLTFAFYFSAKKMMGLRFLNFNTHVQSSTQYNFIDQFKEVLEQLSHVTNTHELGLITQSFFKNSFAIQPSRATLYIRTVKKDHSHPGEQQRLGPIETIVEHFINQFDVNNTQILEHLRHAKIVITDEIEFNQFYDEDTISKKMLPFLSEINADIFLPIYERETIIAYIIIEKDARPAELYSNIERDEIVAFASYLGNIINLLQHRNLAMLIQQEKKMSEELYQKHQEINQYKESIRSFLHTNRDMRIGILFYKNRRFVYGNQAAKELIGININAQDGHPLAKILKKIVQQVSDFKTPQTMLAKNGEGNKLIIAGIPHLEENSIIITVHYPEIPDIIAMQLQQIKNPSEWDYLLYLETTQSGQLINQLIPGSGKHLINFKIELLKLALSKKALLLDVPEQDLIQTVEIIHHISLRQNLHILKLQSLEKNSETAIKLFGINTLFGQQHEIPLLEKLNTIGTLFIHNVHFLDLETQRYLAEYLQYGYFHVFKSDQKIISNVRIVCSTNQNLAILVQEGKFSKELFQELKEAILHMPPLITLPEQELNDLADGFAQQALKSDEFKNLLDLTDKEKYKLASSRPMSLQEFKTLIQNTLVNKSKKNNIFEETQFDPAYNIRDPELIQAARLGKKALKDPKIMAILWRKFENQNKIATFLGVNRSSVNRRCKEYNLGS